MNTQYSTSANNNLIRVIDICIYKELHQNIEQTEHAKKKKKHKKKNKSKRWRKQKIEFVNKIHKVKSSGKSLYNIQSAILIPHAS